MFSILNNQKGITLIELLSSLVILSIVLIGFFSVFTQSASMQNTNEEEMIATNLARVALEDVRDLNTDLLDLGTYTQFNQTSHPHITSVNSSGQFHKHPSFQLQLELSEEPDTSLWLAKILINKDGETLADTYTYIEVDEE
ncbi:prepilin-type N-terminal cleavage/methylation domain-containing protein [Piscibacillus salipiscarius]|uniref:Prepilin-type N-terminal cleavage/methylation domain-containing protein n=2 Tax=Piscibacillus salipiscarius TaxID=299480 RepID=A0ABW5QB51_9BACI|nr:type II secretion system protein [Piscibacillus salipiscarius]